MAGTTLSRHQFNGLPESVARDSVVQLNNAITDLETVRRILSVQTTAVSNGTTVETDLLTYALAASKLATTGAGVFYRMWGTTTNNANTKTLKVYFGSTAHISLALTASQAGRWVVDAYVYRTGASTQDVSMVLVETTAALAAAKGAHVIATDTQTDTSAITLKCTGTSNTASSDINCEGMIVQFLPSATELVAAKIGNEAGTAISA